MKEKIKDLGFYLFILFLIVAAIGFDVFRWHTFQEATDSDVSYWKWRFFIDRTR